jgi:hypothetical protein
VLIKIALTGTMLLCVCTNLAHTGKLVESRENLALTICLLTFIVQHVYHANKPLNKIEDAGLLPYVIPQVSGCIARLAGRITRTSVIA